ncbi:MAG: VOC family protein [Mangrovibacterium sp.]
MTETQQIRLDHEFPEAIEKWGWRYHHLGIPTKDKMPGERYLEHLKFYVSGFSTSPFGIEWMRFDDDCPLSALIKSVPHIAFEVDDIDKALSEHDFEIISEPGMPSEGVRAAMIKHNGVPIELIEFNKNK